MKSAQKRWFRSSRALGFFAIAGALGGIALVTRPTPARPLAGGGGPLVVSPRAPLNPNANGLLGGVVPSFSFLPESTVPTDRCVVDAPRVDDRFSIPAPRVDDRFVVPPRVQGLPVSGR